MSFTVFKYSARRLIGLTKSDNITRMIQLIDVYSLLLRFNGVSGFRYDKRLILLSAIQLSGGHYIYNRYRHNSEGNCLKM
jgi:hypothetical protein